MRNEIFARHGRILRNFDLRACFESRNWYRLNKSYSDSLLTEREKRNAGFIVKYQEERNLLK